MSVTYYQIDEATARTAWYNVHMGDYREGSTTASYRAAVDEAAALVEERKAKVSPFYHDKLDALLDSYARRLAEWQNAYNRNTASCPSVFIAGASNFPVHKKEKQNAREDRLWGEYDEIKAILDKIKAVGTGAVDLNDPHAREMLTEQLQRYQTQLDQSKEINAYYRKHKSFDGCPHISPERAAKWNAELADAKSRGYVMDNPVPSYELTSMRGKIKRLQARLDELDKLQAAAEQPAETEDFIGGQIVRNAELNRLQIIFDEVPDTDTRNELKSNGFRWSPTNRAWQRQLTDNAERAARHILGID